MQSRSLPAASWARGSGTACAAPRTQQRPRCATLASAAVGAAPAVFHYTQLELTTGPGISVHNIMPQIQEEVAKAGVKNGFVNVLSRCGLPFLKLAGLLAVLLGLALAVGQLQQCL